MRSGFGGDGASVLKIQPFASGATDTGWGLVVAVTMCLDGSVFSAVSPLLFGWNSSWPTLVAGTACQTEMVTVAAVRRTCFLS